MIPKRKYEKYTGYFENPSFANRLYLPAYGRQCKIKESPQSVLIIRIIVAYLWRRQLVCGDNSPQKLREYSSQNSALSVSCDTEINWIQKYNRYKTVSFDTEKTMPPYKPFLLIRIIMFRLTRCPYRAIVSSKSREPWLRKNCTSGIVRTQSLL